MRIVIGLRSLFPGKVGGLETYVRELINAWGETRREDKWIVLVNPDAAPTFQSPGPWMHFETVAEPHDLHAWKTAAERHAPAIYFSPMLVIDPHDVALPTVVNIPDVQHLFYPDFFDPETLAFRHLHFPLSARRAAAIVTLSDHARTSIIERLGAKPEKVHDILLAAGDHFHQPPDRDAVPAFLKKHGLPPEFGFYPANFWPHKNHAALFDALSRYRKTHGDAPHVALSGFAGGNQEKVLAAIRAKKLEDRIHLLGYLEHDEVPVAYRAAGFLVFPSLFEGFGIPVAEAMASGCPVLASSASSIPELAGEAALLFNPLDPDDLVRQLRRLLTEPGLRERLIRSGLQRSGELTWGRTADETYAVFKSVAAALAAQTTAPVAVIPLNDSGEINRERLPAAAPAPILHFSRPGGRLSLGAAQRAAEAFRGSGLGAIIGSVEWPAGEPGAPSAPAGEPAGFDTLRLKSEDSLPLQALWIGPDLSAEFLAWLAQGDPPAAYEIMLRAATLGPVGDNRALRTIAAKPPERPASPERGARLSLRYFGVPDSGWLRRWAAARLARWPGFNATAALRPGARSRTLDLYESWLWFRLTGVFPARFKERLTGLWRRARPAPPSADGWIGRQGQVVLAKPVEGQIRLRLQAPEWPNPPPPQLTIRLGRTRLYRGTLCQPGLYDFNWPWPGAAESVTLHLSSSATFIPAEHGMGMDGRELSFRILS
jgi:glycosyltransferase involved in cell wall biosynthesis